MSGHTPGPWAWHCEPGVGGELHSAHGAVISHAWCEGMWFGRYDKTEDAANARLMAAAPEMLATLMHIRRMGYTDISDRFMVDDAIAKATAA